MTNPFQLTSRRQFLRGTAASILFTASASAPLFIPSRSEAQTGAEVWLIVAAGAAIMSALENLKARGGGLGDQFAAANVKLDQILRNQIYTLEAISVLQKSIERLEQQIGGKLTEERYKDLAIKTFALQDDAKRFLGTIPIDGPLNQTGIAEYGRKPLCSLTTATPQSSGD